MAGRANILVDDEEETEAGDEIEAAEGEGEAKLLRGAAREVGYSGFGGSVVVVLEVPVISGATKFKAFRSAKGLSATPPTVGLMSTFCCNTDGESNILTVGLD